MGLGFVLVAAFGIAVPRLYDDTGLLYGFTAVLLACAVGLQLCFLRQFKAPVQGKSLLKDVLQADSRLAIFTDQSGRVTWLNDATRCYFRHKINLDMNMTRLFADAVIDADACVARLIRRALGSETVCYDVIEGPDQVRLTVQKCDPNSFLWRLLDRDRVADMSSVIEKMAMPAVVVSRSELRIISVNSAAQKLIPASINYLSDFFETRQPEFGVVSTLLTQGGSRQMSAIDVVGDDAAVAVMFVAMPQRSGDDLKDDKSFHKVPVPLLKLAINGDLLMANEAARRLLGIKSVENINLRDLMNGLGRSLND